MRRSLRYFMWGFQPHFRMSMQMEAEQLLAAVGWNARPQALLIGFAATKEAQWPICIEPEHRYFQPEHLKDVTGRAEELYRSNPRSEMFYSDARSHDLVHRGLRDHARAMAVAEALGREAQEPLSYFAGASTSVGEYEVHPVLGVPTNALARVPQLRTVERDELPVCRSLVHSAIDVVLALAHQALYQPDAGDSLRVLGASTDELARRAATNFVASSVRLTGSTGGGALFGSLSAVATTRYEGESGFGSIVAAADDDDNLGIDVRLRSPVRLSDTRAVRKMLEISDRSRVALLSDGTNIFGLGHVRSSYTPDSERIFDFHVVGDGNWLMQHARTVLLTVEFGNPRLPKSRIDREQFVDTATRVFAAHLVDAERLWQLALVASEQAHGTMLVVSEAAATEAERLAAQAIVVDKADLSPELLYRATSIDGAVLFAPDGTCYALGVILDGTATDEGDRSRGSRFNSAVRYLSSATAPAMIVLVSEDGMIDVLPRLHPRISRTMLDEAIERYRRLTCAGEVDMELRAEAFQRIEHLAFYLSAEQCELINRLESEFQERQLAEGGFGIVHQPFNPNPALDDSYFLDAQT
jgi:hypothetical protein